MVDIGQEMSYAVFDILGELGFVQSFNCINSPNYRDLLGLLFTWPKAGVLFTSLKSYKFLIPFLYFLLPRDIVEKSNRLWELCVKKVHQWMEMVPDHKDIMAYILPDGERKGLTVPEIETNGFILIRCGDFRFSAFCCRFLPYAPPRKNVEASG